MALDSVRLGTSLAAEVQAARPADGSAITDAELQAIWRKISAEIIKELTTNGVVTVQTKDGPATGTIS